MIYNSPYYGFETRAELFFDLRRDHPNLVGFKEFGGSQALTYAAEHITSADERLILMVGVDTQVFHGYVRCGAVGAITGVGNCLPTPVLRLLELCQQAANGDAEARRLARELNAALEVLSTFDEGPDLVLYYKYLLVLLGDEDYAPPFQSHGSAEPKSTTICRDAVATLSRLVATLAGQGHVEKRGLAEGVVAHTTSFSRCGEDVANLEANRIGPPRAG